MPQIKPLSEFNTNQNALIEDLSHSGEPCTSRATARLASW